MLGSGAWVPFLVPGVGLWWTSAHQHSTVSWSHHGSINDHIMETVQSRDALTSWGFADRPTLSPTGHEGESSWLGLLQVHKGDRPQDKTVSRRGRQLGFSHHVPESPHQPSGKSAHLRTSIMGATESPLSLELDL